MNKDEFKGNWKQLKGQIKEKWAKLTDDDLGRIDGNIDQFIGLLQSRYGYEKERIEREINNWKREEKERAEDREHMKHRH